jgi:disulfide bond formation protein DsbB
MKSLIDKDSAVKKLHGVRIDLTSLIIGALTILWTQAFQAYVNENLKTWNFLGINFVVFELFFVGAVIVVLSWFGITKPREKKN